MRAPKSWATRAMFLIQFRCPPLPGSSRSTRRSTTATAATTASRAACSRRTSTWPSGSRMQWRLAPSRSMPRLHADRTTSREHLPGRTIPVAAASHSPSTPICRFQGFRDSGIASQGIPNSIKCMVGGHLASSCRVRCLTIAASADQDQEHRDQPGQALFHHGLGHCKSICECEVESSLFICTSLVLYSPHVSTLASAMPPTLLHSKLPPISIYNDNGTYIHGIIWSGARYCS